MEALKRIDWRKVEKTDDLNYLRGAATKLSIKWVGTSKDNLRKNILAERSVGRKKLVHKEIGARDEAACAKLPSKTAQIKFLFGKGYHPQTISLRVTMHITNVYATLRRFKLINTGKSIKPEVIAQIRATIAAKHAAVEAEAKAKAKKAPKASAK